jgi:hypothetical protein
MSLTSIAEYLDAAQLVGGAGGVLFHPGRGFLMTIRPLRLGRKLLLGSGAFTGLLLGWIGTGGLSVQTCEAGTQPVAVQDATPAQRNYLNKSIIQLPIQINEQSRSLIAEIHLYVKDHPSAPWTMRDKVGPAMKAFTFQVPHDGEYFFTMVTMDKQGRGYPTDLRNEPPGLVVVIDTQPPQVELTNLGRAPEGQLIRCDVRDANLDTARTKFLFQGGDRVFRALEPVPGRPDVYCIPTQAVCTGIVRAIAEDLAGNQTLREVHLNQIATLKGSPANPPQHAPALPSIEMKSLPDNGPKLLPMDVAGVPDGNPTEKTKHQVAPSVSLRPDGSDGPRLVEHTSDSSPVTAQANHQELPKRQFVNSTKAFLDYQIENVGQSGVGKVEVWITRDRAKSWQKISEETQSKSPVEIQFPGDGLFGVTLVASNGRGVAVASPAAGDAPDWWIEVDTTKPSAQITKIYSATENGKSVVHIHWTVQDKNPSDAPVDLFYAATPQGPWLPVAKGLKAEGEHRWVPPTEIGAQAHLRLEARDAAGNTSVVISQEPVLFDDPARPRAVIRSITTGTSSTAPSAPPAVTPTPGPLPALPTTPN